MADHKSAAMPGYATAALLNHGGSPLRRGRVVVRPRFLGRPCHSPRPDSNGGFRVQGPVGLTASPRGCPITRENRGRRPPGMASPTGRIPKPTTSGTRAQRMVAALPSSNTASRCGDSTRPARFHDAVRIIANRTQRARGIWEFRRGNRNDGRARSRTPTDGLRRPACCPLHHTPSDAPGRNRTVSGSFARSHPFPVDDRGADAAGVEPASRSLEVRCSVH